NAAMGRDPHVVLDDDGCDANGSIVAAAIDPNAVEIGVHDLRIREYAVSADANGLGSAETGAVQEAAVTDRDHCIGMMRPRRGALADDHIIAEHDAPGATYVQPALHAQVAAGLEADAAQGARHLVPVALEQPPNDANSLSRLLHNPSER